MDIRQKQFKAQSAMEYLMTYGWAILIIAIVLGALFSLGVFNGTSVTTSACHAAPGYLCSGAVYSHSDANIIVTLGQSTGTSWTSANFVFVSQGTPYVGGVPAISFVGPPANTLYSAANQGGLISGETATVYLPVNSITPPVTVGTVIVGSIWAQYNFTYSSQGIQKTGGGYIEIGTLTLKAS